MSPKSCFYFLPKFRQQFFCGGGGEFLSTLKPNSERSLGPRPTFPFPGGVMGNIFEKIHQKAPILLPEMVHGCKNKARFGFAAKKHP